MKSTIHHGFVLSDQVVALCQLKQMDFEKTREIVLRTEAAAQDVLITKDDIVALDFRRQKTREALRAIKNGLIKDDKAWMSFGNIFVKTRASKAQNLLEKDIKETDNEISKCHEKLKEQVKLLRDLEGKPELKGFDLKPITKEAEVIIQSLSR